MSGADLESLFRDRRYNAALGWLFVAVLLGVAAEETVAGQPLWAAFAIVVAILVMLPPIAYRNPVVMVPWEVVALAALPIVGRAVASWQLTSALATATRCFCPPLSSSG